MTFTVQGTVTMDGKAAKAEIKALGDETKKAAAGAEQFSRSGKSAAGSATALGTQNKFAAGSVSNLTAQFNDIGVMLAAGQNPLQMAIQQGTQITQVFGQAGAAQAGMMLKQALVSMISPLNLITIGAIAGGAALLQWAMAAGDAGEETATFKDIVDELATAVSNYKKFAGEVSQSTSEFTAKFGAIGKEASAVTEALATIAKLDAIRQVDTAVEALTERFGGLSRTTLTWSGGVMSELDATFYELRETLELTDVQAATVLQSLERLATADTMAAKVAAANQLNQSFLAVFGSVEKIPKELLAVQREALLVALQVADIGGAADTVVIKKNAATQAAQKLLAELRGEAQIHGLILQYGEDSKQVAMARLKAERDNFVELTNSRNISESLKAELVAAWDASRGIASVDMAGNISLAANQAERLYANLAAALSLSPEYGARSVRSGIKSGEVPPWAESDMPETDADRAWDSILENRRRDARKPPPKTRKSGGRSAARAAQREQKAIDDLIASQKRQIDLIRETDPVQKEMIENRRVLAKATEAERDTVEKLIATRIEEEAAVERATDNAELLKNTAYDALEGLILRGEKGSEVMANLAEAIAKAALQSALLGTGPFASLFGTSDSGGLLGTIAGALFPGAQKNADGGIVYGMGGPREDKVPVLASPGEFWVNAQATAANRGVLEYINAGGRVSGFAGGGMVAAPALATMPATGGAGGGTGRVVIQIMPSDLFDARVIEQSQGVMVEGLEQYRQQSLAGDIEAYSNDPARRG